MPSLSKVVVTGGSGRVGRYVVDELASGFNVTNADLTQSEAAVDYTQADVTDLDSVRRAVKGADAVVHLAALDYDWNAAPEQYIRVNTMGTWNVLQAAAENDVRKVVLCSSISACGLSEMRPDWTPQALQVDERHELRPVQAYSVSKQIMETMGRSFAYGSPMDVLCLRPLAVVLPETITEYTAFIDNPETHWLYYYVHARDVATGFRKALEARELKFGTFFLSADDTSHPEPTLDWYRSRIGGLPEITNPRLFQLNPRASIFSNRQARELLGWEPTTDFLSLRAELGA
ncbi:NAD-dependent dehydratase [Mycolicibacterium conceptionense]|uniref:NAD-dependent dehydratase n=1 Tax=Mycolicibacterium conceptionense TaxID=451644 RepID=A0A1A0P753_9MYCO|nr:MULTISPECIES: NAD(P)-dependent oxidoreductase [Mycolicibacterium]MCW1822301.1 NAD(P)-dependent oxidoreductase [Mycolicibacterium senegalense]OBB05487.1 NAD-dependent dehydratase [Mycolicibacterium conceptionense]OBE96080.1 NAD-dependent dehydratase [Mycolicibacterium conceptionense]OBF19615.1 NAD-dependent dehydratase [Mycolicibacterium conceptionense]OBF48149.1 NAD-dependent dehydratase [Mycolicibacterium conceptionense]